MFDGLPSSSSWLRRHRTIACSVAFHLGALGAIIFHRPAVVKLEPLWLAYGDGSHSYRVTYFPPGPDDPSQEEKLVLPRNPSTSQQSARTSKIKPAAKHDPAPLEADVSDHNAKAGSPLGTLIEGPIAGHEVHVAYPVVFPDPPVARSQLPAGLAGDVVIEVTIDSSGNVVETHILEAIGHGVDEKIEATLRQWRYQPATLDGIPVASKHDVHFHFPS